MCHTSHHRGKFWAETDLREGVAGLMGPCDCNAAKAGQCCSTDGLQNCQALAITNSNKQGDLSAPASKAR